MLKLSQTERQIFTLLLDLISHKKLDLTVRVAGGWVRDKMLGRNSTDIDIALDKMMGQEFILILSDYLKLKQIESHGFGVIKKAPEKSKHLETATIQIYGLWVDFVNLRGEEYTEHSRIPIQAIGTPLDDAYRRDFTINALFYNINEDKIEDFTEKGIDDLKLGIIRTPLNPYQTFIDDPLRILRAFRFSARFDYHIEEEAYKTIQLPIVKEMFVKKISKERVGKEFEANFKNLVHSKRCIKFLEHIHTCGYWPCILLTNDIDTIEKGYDQMVLLEDKFDELKKYYLELSASNTEITLDEMVYLSYLAVLNLHFFDPKIQDSKKQFVFDVIKNRIKLPIKMAMFTTRFQTLLVLLKNVVDDFSVVSLALWQRECGDLWEVVYLSFNIIYPEREPVNVREILEKNGLIDFHGTKCLLNGSEAATYFNVSKEDIKKKLDQIVLWQAMNPGKTKEDFLREHNFV